MEFSEKTLNKSVIEVFEEGDIEIMNNIIQSSQFQEYLVDNNDTLITLILSKCTEKLWQLNRNEFLQYRKILHIMSEKSNENAIYSLLEQIEETDVFYEKFLVIISSLSIVLRKLGTNRGCYLEYSLNLIGNYVNNLNPPVDTYEEDDEEKLMGCDGNTEIISYIYKQILLFSDSFRNELVNSFESDAFLLLYFRLLGKPFLYINLECNSTLYSISQSICKYICDAVLDINSLLEYVDEKDTSNTDDSTTAMRTSYTSNEDLRVTCEEISMLETQPWDYKRNIPRVSLGGFFYLLLCHNDSAYMPCVYDTAYICHKILYLCIELLSIDNQLVIAKGLALSYRLFDRLKCGQLTCYLEEIHKPYFCLLSSIGVYSPVSNNRSLVAKLLSKYFRKFDLESKYLLFSKVAHFSDNSEFNGYVVSLFKDEVFFHCNKREFGDYFTGKRFADLVYHFCSLKNGPETEVNVNGPEIRSGISLLRFIFMYDKMNSTKIWDYIDIFENKYCTEMKEGIVFSRNYYRKLLQKLQNNPNEFKNENLNLTVRGKSLQAISIPQKIEAVKVGLSGIDMVETALDWLCDVVNSRQL